MTLLLLIHATLTMKLWYASTIATIESPWVIAMTGPQALHFALIIRMWAGGFWWKTAQLIVHTIVWSTMFCCGTVSSLHKIRRPSATLDICFRVGPRPPAPFLLQVFGSTVSHLLARVEVGLGFDLGLSCCLDCSLSCSLGLGFDNCRSRHCSGSLPCIASACCESSILLPSCLAVSSFHPLLLPWWMLLCLLLLWFALLRSCAWYLPPIVCCPCGDHPISSTYSVAILLW